jgi:transcription elongation factor Elf1
MSFNNNDINKVDRPRTPQPLNKERSLLKMRRDKQTKPVFIDLFEEVDFMCDICDLKMLKVDKGQFANKYVCRNCGLTVDPREDYIKHPSQVRTATDEEGLKDKTPFVQSEDPERMKPKPHSMYDILDESEEDLKKQLYSKGYQLVKVEDKTSDAVTGQDFNKVQRPTRFKPTEEEYLL